VGEPENKIPPARPKGRWVDQMGRDCIDWIDLASDGDQRSARVNTVMHSAFIRYCSVREYLEEWWLLEKGRLHDVEGPF
jgi:hypothetical protein